MLWFHSSAFSNFWKIGKFAIPFPKFWKTLFQKLEKLFSKNWETILETFQFSKMCKRTMNEACVPKFILDA